MAGVIETVRCFVACDLSLAVLDTLGEVQRELHEVVGEEARIRWASPATMHLTLKFLGDKVDRAVTQAAAEALVAAAAAHPPFELTVAGVGAFPSPAKARVVWAAIREETGVLARVHEAVETALEELGFGRERRAFSPHVTLGRVRRGKGRPPDLTEALEPLAEREIGTCRVADVVLYRSILSAKGPEYESLVRAALSGAPEEEAPSP